MSKTVDILGMSCDGIGEYGWIVKNKSNNCDDVKKDILEFTAREYPDTDMEILGDVLDGAHYRWGWYRKNPADVTTREIEGWTWALVPGTEGKQGSFYGCEVSTY